MKKLLYTIGMLMMLSAAIRPTSLLHAQQFSGKDEDVPFSTARLASKITSAIGLDPNANWADTFGAQDDKDVGKNLYMIIYEKTQNQPQLQANKNIAGRYGMPEADLVRILQGDYTSLVQKKPGMTQEEAMKKIAEIQQNFAEEKDLLQLQADIKAAVEPNEIFANGDINDSGFDLINDLQIIEKLLFLKSDPIDIGGTFGEGGTGGSTPPTPGGTPPASTPSGQSGTGGQQPSGAGGTGGQQPSGAGGTGEQQPSGTAGTGEQQPSGTGGTSGQTGAGAQAPGRVDPNSCFQSNDISKALDTFDRKKSSDSNYKDNSVNQVPFAGTSAAGSSSGTFGGTATVNTSTGVFTGSSGGAADAASNQSATASKSDFLEEKPDTSAPAKAAPPGQWLKEKLCPGFFCLDVQLITKPATSSYQNSDNCIACHAEKINDILKKVIDHSLVPSKAPGNLGESAECKKAMATAFGSISMNFYAIAMPVQTPINDDLIYGTNIEDDWYNYCNAVAFPFSCRKTDPPASPTESTYVIPPSKRDLASKDAIANSSETTTLDTLAKNISTTVSGLTAQQTSAVNAYQISNSADQSIAFFDPLKREMNQMNYFFANIRDLLHSLHERVDSIPGTQACALLADKKRCT